MMVAFRKLWSAILSGILFISLIISTIIFLPNSTAFAISIVDFSIPYPDQSPFSSPSPDHPQSGSTHEIALHNGTLWISGQNHDQLVAIQPDGSMNFYAMPANSGPHGIAFDRNGQLWVALEFAGEVIRLDPAHPDYETAAKYDVRLDCTTCVQKINTHPHGLTIAQDGQTVWYTGKATGTLGRINPNGTVETLPIAQPYHRAAIVGSVPIYIHAEADGTLWFTELVGNAIGRITPTGQIDEFKIPTPNSRPIALVSGADGHLWFTEEASNKIGRIQRDCDTNCLITEFPLPKSQDNLLLAALAFDAENNLWVQQYVDGNHPFPTGSDHLIKIDRQILTANPQDISTLSIDCYDVPTTNTILHRIILGSDGKLWFTELNTDKVGKVEPS